MRAEEEESGRVMLTEEKRKNKRPLRIVNPKTVLRRLALLDKYSPLVTGEERTVGLIVEAERTELFSANLAR